MKILVAMSGGVDSSVVAHLLKREGHDVIGVRFLLWNDPLAPPLAQILPSKCCDAQSAARASAVAKQLGIPLHIIDLSEEFKHIVVDRFIDEERRGLTPNPCVFCNREIKFGKLLAFADELQCEKIATGHYAQVRSGTDGLTELWEAADQSKDQSYYLHGLSQQQLARVMFPLGERSKSDVFELAASLGIPINEHYRESQDLCFFPEKSPEEFLKRHLGDAIRPGPIVRRNGTVIGTHEGLPLYTIGQRRGLGIGGLKIPLEVVAKDVSNNTLVVADRESESVTEVRVEQMHWISGSAPTQDEPIACRTRSLGQKRTCTFRPPSMFRFDDPLPPQTSGQSLVVYRGAQVLGGGVLL